jgi:hypothetical protein
MARTAPKKLPAARDIPKQSKTPTHKNRVVTWSGSRTGKARAEGTIVNDAPRRSRRSHSARGDPEDVEVTPESPEIRTAKAGSPVVVVYTPKRGRRSVAADDPPKRPVGRPRKHQVTQQPAPTPNKCPTHPRKKETASGETEPAAKRRAVGSHSRNDEGAEEFVPAPAKRRGRGRPKKPVKATAEAPATPKRRGPAAKIINIDRVAGSSRVTKRTTPRSQIGVVLAASSDSTLSASSPSPIKTKVSSVTALRNHGYVLIKVPVRLARGLKQAGPFLQSLKGLLEQIKSAEDGDEDEEQDKEEDGNDDENKDEDDPEDEDDHEDKDDQENEDDQEDEAEDKDEDEY